MIGSLLPCLMALLFCILLLPPSLLAQEADSSRRVSKDPAALIEPFPILSYDTDAGLGYGAKVFFLNTLGQRESFDLILFNSTKGVRWYRLVLAFPDLELRQGTVYPLSLDLYVDYDKWIHNNFYGVGNSSHAKDREIYTREPFELSVTASRGWTPTLVMNMGVRFKAVWNSALDAAGRLVHLDDHLAPSASRSLSIFASVRHDGRDSYIQPSRGWVIQAEIEEAPAWNDAMTSWTKLTGLVQGYHRLPILDAVIAGRLALKHTQGDHVPISFLLSVGGNQTLRGYPIDRFLDKSSAVANLELRIPLIWRFIGVLGWDAGKVWSGLDKADFTGWAHNPVLGLRFAMRTYLVRADVGFGRESTGFYLNFGHLF